MTMRVRQPDGTARFNSAGRGVVPLKKPRNGPTVSRAADSSMGPEINHKSPNWGYERPEYAFHWLWAAKCFRT